MSGDGRGAPRASGDTASVPSEDLRDLGIEVPDTAYGLVNLWSAEEWRRLGEIAFFTSTAHVLSVGRGESSPGGHRRAQWVRQRMGEHVFMPPLATSTTSADQTLVTAVAHGLDLENLGRHAMYVDGKQVARCTVEPGQLVYLVGQFLLKCVERPMPMPPPRHLQVRFLGPFGEANPFGMVGESPMASSLLEQTAFAATLGQHVLVHGESGTGKESVARMIHGMSDRASGPFESISAGNLAPSLLEDQLFGHVKDYPQKGMQAREGSFGAADGGTLFIDEIGRMRPDAQMALLRVLEVGEYKQLGGEGVEHSQFRFVGAMNGPVSQLLPDLYARLSTRIQMPLLVERSDDIPLIVRHLLRQIHAKTPKVTRHLVRRQAGGGEEVVPPYWFVEDLMKCRSFEGNVRDLIGAVGKMLYDTVPSQGGGDVRVVEDGVQDDPDEARGSKLTKPEIEWALGKHDGNVSRAAKQLDVSRQSLYRAMERVGIKAR